MPDSDDSEEDDEEEKLDETGVHGRQDDSLNSDKENSSFGLIKRLVYTPYKNGNAREFASSTSDSTASGGTLSTRSPLEDITPHSKKTKNVVPELKPVKIFY